MGTKKFLSKYADVSSSASSGLLENIHAVQEELDRLDDWVHMSGRAFPIDETDRFPSKKEAFHDSNHFPFYPRENTSWVESQVNNDVRTTILRRWLKHLRPGCRYVLISHCNVGAALFKHCAPNGSGKLDNLGIVVAQYQPATADASDGANFFSFVELA